MHLALPLAAVLAIVASQALTSRALAQHAPRPRVALVAPNPALERAARSSLEPWDIEVLVVPPPSPGATMPGTSEAARAVAASHRAAAVVWLSEHESGFALWIYDRQADRVTARRLPGPPPLDEPGAAAVALSIKTLLRHSAVAPARERFGSSAAPLLSAAHAPRSASESARSSVLDLEARAALRLGRARPGAPELRSGFGLLWWPGSDWAGLSVRAAFGPGVLVHDTRLRGRLTDAELTVAGAARYELTRTVRLSASAGASAHFLLLDGVVLAAARPARALRLDPALTAELGSDWLVTRWLRIGPRASVSWLLRRQRYLVRGDGVLTLSTLAFEAGLALAATLPD
jgi:hypothetical protein